MNNDILSQLIDEHLNNKPLENSKESFIQKENEQDVDGMLWVKDGKIIVKDPKGNGRFPYIVPCEGLQLIINNKQIYDPTPLKEEDEVRVEFTEEGIVGNYKVNIAEDKLSAILEIKTSYDLEKNLKDQSPTRNLLLEIEKTRKNIGWDFTFTELIEYLSQAKLIYGVKSDLLKAKYDLGEDASILIAEGIPPSKTIDETVEILFSGRECINENLLDQIAKVNFREMTSILSVEKDTVLAIKHPACIGKPGIAVTGEPVPPTEPKKVSLKAGLGVEIIDGGARAIAITSGQPRAEALGNVYKISINPILVHNGDVDIVSGNIKFKGNVKIIGNVQDLAIVDATENIEIIGNVGGAKLFAGKDIKVREKVIASTLRAGGINAYCAKLMPVLKDILDDMEDMKSALVQLINNSIIAGVDLLNNRGIGQLIVLLKERKFTQFDKDLKKVIDLIEKADVQLPEEVIHLGETLENFLLGPKALEISNLSRFDLIRSDIIFVNKNIKKLKKQKSKINLDYAQNCKIIASGDVYVAGQGCFTTEINSGGNTKINGIFRGGQIYSEGNVFVNEIGTEIGTRTEIQVPRDKSISINVVYEDVYIRIGNRRYRFDIPSVSVLAKLDQRDNLYLKCYPLEKAEEE